MASLLVPSRGWAGRIVSPPVVARGTATPVVGVVGPVRQVDFGVHPYPPHLLLEPASMQGPADLGLTGRG
jgi:hypothetical protein